MKRTGPKIRCYQITSEGIISAYMLKEEWQDSVQDFLTKELLNCLLREKWNHIFPKFSINNKEWYKEIKNNYHGQPVNLTDEDSSSIEEINHEENVELVWVRPESLKSDIDDSLARDIHYSCTSNQDWIRLMKMNGFIAVPKSVIQDDEEE